MKYPKTIQAQAKAASLGVFLDTAFGTNFILDEDGNAMYIDSPIFGDPDKIESVIAEKLQGKEKEYAMYNLGKFRKLNDLYVKELRERLSRGSSRSDN